MSSDRQKTCYNKFCDQDWLKWWYLQLWFYFLPKVGSELLSILCQSSQLINLAISHSLTALLKQKIDIRFYILESNYHIIVWVGRDFNDHPSTTTCLGQRYLSLLRITVRIFFLITIINLFSFSLKPLPLFLSYMPLSRVALN